MSLFRLGFVGFLFASVVALTTLPGRAEAPDDYASFEEYEAAMFVRIDALAAEKGLDLTPLHQERNALQAEYEEARRRNDQAGMQEANALRAHIIRFALENLSD